MIVIRGGSVLTRSAFEPELDVIISGDRIENLERDADVPGAREINAVGLLVAPGYIDVHVHGGGGFSLLEADAEQMRQYAHWVTRCGVTSFLAGIVAPTPDRGVASVEAVLKAASTPLPASAELLGFHMEGPFISPVRHGAFDPRSLRPPDKSELARYLQAAGGLARLITIAPELPGAEWVALWAIDRDVRVSMGHTDATLEQAREGFRWGISHVTHCFNAMRPFSHRDPGAIGAALTTDNVTCELIGDGIHVDPAAMDMLIRCKGRNTVLVTDGIELAGVGDGAFQFGRRQVAIRGGVARLDDGTIAGSITTMDANVRNVVALGVAPQVAIRMASANPARVAGVASRKGKIEPGFDADLVLLNEGLEVQMTVVRGQVVYCR
ncbi:MAG: N-acetylglucosamine-6-phosphate deacetylase [Chloroflexi bacterium]|nr:N-acetylglucosamine-6-phosphate deacetylase [Chloroflexota bacterium]